MWTKLKSTELLNWDSYVIIWQKVLCHLHFQIYFNNLPLQKHPNPILWELVFEDGIASLTHYLDSMIKVRLQVGKNNEEKV